MHNYCSPADGNSEKSMEENAWIEDRVKDVLAGDEYIDLAKFQKIFGFKNVGLIWALL